MDMNGTGSTGNASRKRPIIGIAAIVVIIAAGTAWWMYQTRETSKEIVPGQTLVTAQPGNIVRKFPEELILEDGPEVLKSYRIEYSEGNVTQPFARYVSQKPFSENVQLFSQYFKDHEWEMYHMGSAAETPMTSFYGRKGRAQANVVIKQADGQVEVSIAYVLKP